MSPIKYILPALTLIGWASAQCSSTGTLNIENQADAGALGGCATYTGSIAVATGTTDRINFPGVRAITGDLVIRNAPNVTALGADSLKSVGGALRLVNSQMMGLLTFPELTSVGSLELEGLPNLNSLGFPKNIQQCNTLSIQNTFLGNLNGISLKQVQSITIANNRMLQDITFQMTTIQKTVSIESNGDQLDMKFPQLQSAQNLTFRNVPKVTIPALKTVSGSLGFYQSSFDTISAPNLTSVGGTLAVISNNKLTNLSLPVLTTINGGFQVQNNSILTEVNVPSLQTIGGAFDFFGAFTDVKLPALKDCKGAFNLQSSGDIANDCSTFQSQSGPNNVIKGKFLCKGKLSAPGNANTNGGTSGKKSAAVGNAQLSSSLVGFAGFLIALLTLF